MRKAIPVILAGLLLVVAALWLIGHPTGDKVRTHQSADRFENVSDIGPGFLEAKLQSDDNSVSNTQSPGQNVKREFISATKTKGQKVAQKNSPEGTAVDLTGMTTNAEKIAKILESFGPGKTFSSDDPRLAQLQALGESAVNDLLDAYDNISAISGENKKEAVLKSVLESMLGEDDKDIILTYFHERADFQSLVWKYRFVEAGAIALERLKKKMPLGIKISEGRWVIPTHDAETAAAFYPEKAVPYMLTNAANENGMSFLHQLSAVAKHAPDVDIRPALKQSIAVALTKDKPSRFHLDQLAALALVRGMPEGFDAAKFLLRQSESKAERQEMLEVVRNFIQFRGSAAETAKWIEENRGTLEPEAQLPFGIRAQRERETADPRFPQDVILRSPYAPQSGTMIVANQEPGTTVVCPYTGKKFIFP